MIDAKSNVTALPTLHRGGFIGRQPAGAETVNAATTDQVAAARLCKVNAQLSLRAEAVQAEALRRKVLIAAAHTAGRDLGYSQGYGRGWFWGFAWGLFLGVLIAAYSIRAAVLS